MTIEFFDLAAQNDKIMFGPYCWRVRMSLLHKGLDFNANPWRFSDKSATANSGFATVPVIKDGETWVGDSWEIVQYLDKQYPDKPTLIGDNEQKAQIEAFIETCQTKIFPTLVPIAILQVHDILDPESQAYFRETREAGLGNKLEDISAEPEVAKANLAAALSLFEGTLSQQAFFGGNQPNYSDYTLFGILKWADIVSSYRPIDDNSIVGKWFVNLENMYDGYAAKVATVRNQAA
jgi:glutathione S-transferase